MSEFPGTSTSSSSPSMAKAGSSSSSSLLAQYAPITFTQEQIDCICDSLQQRGDIKRLNNFLNDYQNEMAPASPREHERSQQHQASQHSHEPNTPASAAASASAASSGGEPSEAVLRARAYAAFESNDYRELYRLIESRDFDPKHHAALQNMWYTAHYKEAEAVRGRSLGK